MSSTSWDARRETRTRRPPAALRALYFAACALLAFAAVALLATSVGAAPTVRVTSPVNLDVIAGGTVAINLTINNFQLNGSAVGGPAVAGEGHYHIMLDGVYQRYDYRAETFLADVPEGNHTITIELAENNHTLLGINDSVTIEIAVGSPRIRLVDPGWGATVQLNWTRVAVIVGNFSLQPSKIGQAPVAGEGHWHFFLDGVYQGATGDTEAILIDLSPGTHTIRVDLRQNNHLSLGPEVYDEAVVTVLGKQPSVRLNIAGPDAIVWGSSTTLTVTVVNFTLDAAAIGNASINGVGHYQVLLDGSAVAYGASATFELTGIAAGDHAVVVRLVSNDNSSLGIPVQGSLTIHAAPVPGIAITAPTSPTVTTSNSLTCAVSVTNFTLAPDKIGQSAEAGVGHYHIFVDGVYVGASAGLTFNVSALTVGMHNISVRPFNNNHTSIPGTTEAVLTVTVQTAAPPPTFLPAAGAEAALAAVAATAALGALSRRRSR